MLLGRSLTQVRYASSKSLKPHPRPFKRRLLEAAVAPIMPPEAPKQCLPVYEKQRILQEYEAEVIVVFYCQILCYTALCIIYFSLLQSNWLW